MLNLQHRIQLLVQLGDYILANPADWQAAKARANVANAWFTDEFIDLASTNIARQYLTAPVLEEMSATYQIADPSEPKTVGIVMAGNIPLVGFHDWLCVFLSGHRSRVKLSSKDNILFPFLLDKLKEWNPALARHTETSELLRGCDAYIATGSDNSARYFDYYFSKYPHIIRRNRSSVAVLDGTETAEELEALADDTHLYFGLGCRNVTKLYVPRDQQFEPILDAMKKYRHFFDHAKYKNNYDYQLAILLLNNQYYMTNGSVLLVENESIFSPISQINYSFYDDPALVKEELISNESVQCVVGHGFLPFGQAQSPRWCDYADKVDTMTFLVTL
ncbi:MAG TPA: acyl-CoA reductase [Flavihumibacter sp.]